VSVRYISIVCLFLTLSFSSVGQAVQIPVKTEVIVFHAGSLNGPFQEIAKAFEAVHPEIKIVLEGSGSREAARKVTELNRPCDIVASADYETIDTLMKPEFAKFNVFFARNKAVLVYTDKSKYADEINGENWYDILARPDVEYGHTDPNLDPGGYRAVLSLKLAEKYYRLPGLYQKVTENFHDKNIVNDGKIIGEKLHAGQLDYFFMYESSAKQGGYRYVKLPEQIDFSSVEYADYYKQAALKLTGKTEGSFIEVKGQPIIYSVTLVNNSPHRKEALEFLEFLLTNGQSFMNKAGFIPMNPPQVRKEEGNFIPSELRHVVKALK
jgi:molybdate/tungstate transport system substrate-binding protein